jgi:hypothetical protein
MEAEGGRERLAALSALSVLAHEAVCRSYTALSPQMVSQQLFKLFGSCPLVPRKGH